MPIEQIKKINTIFNFPILKRKSFIGFSSSPDSIQIENKNLDKKILKDKGIISENQDINLFLDDISKRIFTDKKDQDEFSKLLKSGVISLSSSCLLDLNNPKSAVSIVLEPDKSTAHNLLKLQNPLALGQGVGINFSKFDNPNDEIKQINKYFKYKEPSLKRHPAGIALLDIRHPKILDFISLKDNEEYKDWCFDLSVIMDDKFLDDVSNDREITLSNGKKIKAKIIYQKLLSSMLKKGEPGVIFSSNPDYLCDCCATSELKENEGLTLGHINLSKLYDKKTSSIDYNLLKNASLYLAKAMKKIDSDSYIGILGYAELLKLLNIDYGSNSANEILQNCLKEISLNAHNYNLKTAISPTGTISRFLKTSPSIEPINPTYDYLKEINTLSSAQKYLDGSISKTIILKDDAKEEDIDFIIQNSSKKGLKGISVFKPL